MTDMYPQSVDNFILAGSLLSFSVFLVWVVFGKIASRGNAIAALNKAHFRVGIIYAGGSILVIVWKFPGDLAYALSSLLVGLFCYFTYHYVFLMSIIGLAKKSISANILLLIKSAQGHCSIESLSRSYGNGKGFSFIRKDRLRQMSLLKFATEYNSEYAITLRGKAITFIGRLILRIWNLERL